MQFIEIALLMLVVVCGICTCLTKNLMVSLIIFMAYSIIMSIVWAMLEAPDLAITEAAVGAGISGILMFVTLKTIRDIRREDAKKSEKGSKAGAEEKTYTEAKVDTESGEKV